MVEYGGRRRTRKHRRGGNLEGGRRRKRYTRHLRGGGGLFSQPARKTASGIQTTRVGLSTLEAATAVGGKQAAEGVVRRGTAALVGATAGRVAARAVPVLGWGLAAYDVGSGVNDAIKRGEADAKRFGQEVDAMVRKPMIYPR